MQQSCYWRNILFILYTFRVIKHVSTAKKNPQKSRVKILDLVDNDAT